ncbi:unnamed protein product [Paramecium primaurelia]|uniref:Queuosine 5'-phosphate N-glycosylase/hydrolase n=1 Tax=Paramecium primaurelia TaxID=5886 RepID=A0A8S1PAG0_PARPR|nr:unnamed protein product [Paramecium primaurelia]
MSLVRNSCQFVSDNSKHVKINKEELQKQVNEWYINNKHKYKEFDEYECHLGGDEEQIVDFLFILDSLNFCFWPQKDYEYENLSSAIKECFQKCPQQFKAESILKMTFEEFQQLLFPNFPNFPLITERFRLLQHASEVLMTFFEGEFVNVIKAAKNSAAKLLNILTTQFLGFQDHAIYQGRQTFFYKRSQILIGDIYAALKGQGLGKFNDIEILTMFPDYRVPQILNQLNVLQYDEELQNMIKNEIEINHGSEYEIEIRANSVIAVELIKEEFKKLGQKLNSIEVDWMLWQMGEELRFDIVPHHRTLSIYY